MFKRHSVYFIVIFFIISVFVYKSINRDEHEHIKLVWEKTKKIKLLPEYRKLRRLAIELEPKIKSAATPLQLAIILRNHIYQTIPDKKNVPGFPFRDLVKSYKQSVMDDQYGQWCQGMSIVYQSLLEAFLIPSRGVHFFSATEKYDSHASVEIFIDNEWISSDPTFNVMAKYNNKYISYKEARDLLQKNKKVIWTSNGMKIIDHRGRDINQYYISMKKLLKYLVLRPARVVIKNKVIEFSHEIYPQEWDMILTIKSNKYDLKPGYLEKGGTQGRFSWGENRIYNNKD